MLNKMHTWVYIFFATAVDGQTELEVDIVIYKFIFQLNAYIDDLAAQNDFISTVSIGKSHEGRDMRVIQIAKAGAGAPNVWIEAGIHARLII